MSVLRPFRQWDGNLSNALAHLNKGYAWALDNMRDSLDQGQDPDEELTLGVGCEVDLGQLESDRSFILIDEARVGSDILQRIHCSRKKGGIHMCAEVYRWITETSDLGLAEQAARLIDLKQASSEAGLADAIESWQEKSDRLARHWEAYKLPDTYNKIALKHILVGETRERFRLRI